MTNRNALAQGSADQPTPDELSVLVEYLRSPKQWCCIFEHKGHMRHGTTDAPFKAADEIERLKEENERHRALISEQSIERLSDDIACAIVHCHPEVVAARKSAMVRLGERLRNPLPSDLRSTREK